MTANELLSKDHTILEKGFMDYRPFGVDEQGEKIRDVTGVKVQAYVSYLRETVIRTQGAEAGSTVVEELCRLLNERIHESAYHVNPKFLENVWNSYSYEFLCFLCEFCIQLSRDPHFQTHAGEEKFISSTIQTLGRPFPIAQIYKMFPHFGQKFAKGSIIFEVGSVTDQTAILRMKFTEKLYEQFGPYRKRCTANICQASKAALAAVPKQIHHIAPATVKDLSCIANGDEWCEWEITWLPPATNRFIWTMGGILAGGLAFAYIRVTHPEIHLLEGLGVALLPALISWFITNRTMTKELKSREELIQEQLNFVDARHEELREAYLEQELSTVELRRKVGQLTTLHHAGLHFSATRDREALLQNVLEVIIKELHYDRAKFSFYDPTRRVTYGTKILGVSETMVRFMSSVEIPVADPDSMEGQVFLKGEPLLIGDLLKEWDRIHPINQQLVAEAQSRSLISVPLKVKGVVLGALTVDRTQENALTQDDLNVMVTVANQAAIALDNADAYRQIEALNVGLEAKVQVRTAELETANERLQELDRLKSEFFANISHELRTPLTLSLGTYKALLPLTTTSECHKLIDTGLRNTGRLLFLINELLDLAKFDSGRAKLEKRTIDLVSLIRFVASNFESSSRRRIHYRGFEQPLPIEVDPRQIKKVFFNLLSNAFKFSDPEEGHLWLKMKKEQDRIQIEVEDNGIGIPADQQEHIFDRFTQVEGSASRRQEGSGIGLALVKEVITLHGGTILVESTPGEGSTFTLTLPRGEIGGKCLETHDEDEMMMVPPCIDAREKDHEHALSTPSSHNHLPLIVVADDNADMRAYLTRILDPFYRVVLATNGVEALETAKRLTPDLIVSDGMMPKMSGYDLLQTIRRDDTLRHIPMIMLTALAKAEARIESLNAGADDYIAKPFDEQELLARVKNLIAARAQERELAELRKDKLKRFLPPQLAELIVEGKADDLLKSHRAEITVLFIDLRGFTAFAEFSDPEDVLIVLREYQKEIGQLTSDYEGTLERFSGDSLMIFFNDPIPVEHHAEQGIRMALEMRQRMAGLQDDWNKRGYPLGTGIGIATGYATMGLVGFDRRTDYAAIGPVTNLAARLCGEASNGQILASGRCLNLVEDLVCTESIGPLSLKGFHRPVETYNITGLKSRSRT